MVDHLGQARHTRGQGALAVLVEEELGVGQPRPHHALVATDHPGRVGRPDITDDQEAVGQSARRIQQGEVLLVGLHRQDEALLRHREELGLEAAAQHVRSLHQRRHLVQQGLVLDGPQALACGGFGQLAGDLGAACRKRRDHRALVLQRTFVGIGPGNGDGRYQGFEAVALGGATGNQPQLRLQWHHLITVQNHQTMSGPDEGRLIPSRAGAVGPQRKPHELGHGQLDDGHPQGHLQGRRQRRARLHPVEKQYLCLAISGAPQRRHRCRISTQGRQFLQQCRGGCTAGVQADGHRHQLVRHGPVRGCAVDICHMDCQPAWRRIRRQDARRGDQALRPQAVGQRVCEGFAQLLQGLGRQLLDQQLHQQAARASRRYGHTGYGGVHAQAALLSCCAHCASTSSAQARGAMGKPSRARLCR